MSKVVVNDFDEKTLNSGRVIYKCFGAIDGQPTAFDMWSKPELNHEFEGTARGTDYGTTVSRTASGARTMTRASSPEDRASIERQVALKAAVEFANAKVATGKELSAGDVLSVADAFDRFLKEIPF